MDAAEKLRRREFLGASEVAAVCGLCPFRSALDIWAIKKGYMEDVSSVAADMGQIFEAPLLAYYARRHGRTLTQPGTLKHPTFPWLAATPDSLTACQRNVQAKIVGRNMVWHWDDGCPDYVQAQTQAEMCVAGMPVTDVVTCLGGTDYREFTIERHDAAIGYLVEICERFWRDNIEGNVMPEIDGSDTARRLLQARFPNPTAGMLEASVGFIEMAERYRQVTSAIGVAEQEKDMLANQMKLAIANEAGLKWDGGYVSWKPNKAGIRQIYVHIKELKP